MPEPLTVTILVENSVHGGGLLAEHGIAYHIRAGDDSILFDTGQSSLVVENARRLHIDLSEVGAIALSHGHYDHTGGLSEVWKQTPTATLYAHPAFAARRFTRNPDGSTRDIGPRPNTLEALQAHAAQIRHNTTPVEIGSGVFLTGEIPRETAYEDVGGPFTLDEAGHVPDPVVDDQAVFFEAESGIIVLLGCAHAGVVNSLRHIRQVTHGCPIHTVLGGMHLRNASPERLAQTVAELRELGVRWVGPAHCTGTTATATLWHEFPSAFAACSVGSRFLFRR